MRMHITKTLIALINITPLLLLSGCLDSATAPGDVLNTGPDITDSTHMRLDEGSIVAGWEDGELLLTVPVIRNGTDFIPVNLEVALRTLDLELISKGEAETILAKEVNDLTVSLPGLEASTDLGDLTNYVIHYQLVGGGGLISGRLSLYTAMEKSAIHLLSSSTFYDGLETHVRIVATEPVTERPLEAAQVSLYLVNDEAETLMFAGETDAFGTLSAPVLATADQLGSQTLRVVIDSELGSETIEQAVQVERDDQILITTDKPLYQPGQVIHIRTLSLRRGDLLPAANQNMVLEVEDGRGNKIFKTDILTDDYGIAATTLQLATELNMGEFTIRATMGDSLSERTVTVERYTLPRFTTTLIADAAYYAPGQEAVIKVQGDYLFGEPVAGGSLSARVWQHDDNGDTQIEEHTAVLDENGTYDFVITIPSWFGGRALENGEAFLLVEATVTDGAGEERDGSLVIPVSQNALFVVVFPGQDLVPNYENTFHVLTSDPTGLPVAASCTATLSGEQDYSFDTDSLGSATLSLLIPSGLDELSLEVSCSTEQGASSQWYSTDLRQASESGSIAVLTEESLYSAGDQVEITLIATGGIEHIFFDVIANNRTQLSEEVAMDNGVATVSVGLPLDLTGAVSLSAYHLSQDGSLIRGERLVYVEPLNDLTLSFSTDREEYLPGEAALISVAVTDQSGMGVPAAVGLQIVDEAVYALQDMQPGAERIFFQLEQEMLSPTYDVNGVDIGQVVNAGEQSHEERERAAEILFAASEGFPGYGIVVNTLAAAESTMLSIAQDQLNSDLEVVTGRVQDDLEGSNYDYNYFYEHAQEIMEGFNGNYFDPWGKAYLFEPVTQWGDSPDSFNMTGSGPDEILGTGDDFTAMKWWDEVLYGNSLRDDFGVEEDGDLAAEPPAAGDFENSDPSSDEGGEEGPRVRSYFPETLLVEPALITDSDGTAQIDVTMADSITSWRMTGMASSRSGQLGSSTGGILVFQPFFVEIDFPLSLTQNDELDVPVAVFNFLDTAQEITLTVESEDSWFELLSSESQVVEVEAGEVMSTSFRVRVNEVGYHTFTVSALGGDFPDAVERPVQVLPDGEEVTVAVSDRLEEDTSVLFTIPEEAIENASGLLVKIYPGMFSQVVEGLDSLLAMPSGCFEQTSSSTYPNVLALNYLRQTDQSSPEIEDTALGYISTGYQRLLSYEVEGGGFEWFGNAPAHRILTAYGLLEFDDMSDVYEIDPDLIPRTQNWLLSQQESDGRFRAAPEGIHEGATNNFTDSDLRATAYIAYSLAESGYTGSAIDNAISWIKGDMEGIEDNYTLALIANLLIAHSPSDSELNNILSILNDNVEIEEDAWYWPSDSTSLTYGSGDGMTMETTALVLYAMIQSGAYPNAVEGGMRYLIRNKDTFGTWSSTQATILSLRAFIASLNGASEPADALIGISGNGELATTIEIDDFNADVLQQVDLTGTLSYGDNLAEITFDGEGSFLYQVVGRYYIPWSESEEESPALTLQLTYPDGILAAGEPATVKATVGNNQAERAEMLMLKIGTPPGFDVDLRTLENHVSSGLFSRIDRMGNRIEAYLYGLDGETSVEFEFDIIPRFPMEVQTPHSELYLYYNPEIRVESEPVTVVVE